MTDEPKEQSEQPEAPETEAEAAAPETEQEAPVTSLESAAEAVEIDPEHVRMAEAVLFAAAEPLDVKSIAARLPDGAPIKEILLALGALYDGRGVQLAQFGGKYAFRTAADLAFLMERERQEMRRLSRAAVETLAIIAYHQPVTRAEIEDIRGVAVSKGTLDVLLETEWIKLRGRRRTPGRPVTYGVTDDFMQHFGLADLGDLPGVEELRAAGLLDSRLPPGFSIGGTVDEEEDPLEDDDDGNIDEMIAGTLEEEEAPQDDSSTEELEKSGENQA